MSQSGRIPAVDYLRGLAALAVAWFHLTHGYDNWVAGSGSWGWLGVEIFFVISGFAIPYSLAGLERPYYLRDFPSFVGRRLLRLEPAHLTSIFLVLFLNYLESLSSYFQRGLQEYTANQVVAHLLYLVPLTDCQWIQPVYWTLACECVFYLILRLFFPVIGGHWLERVAVLGVIFLVAVGGASSLFCLFVMGFTAYRRLSAGEGLGWTLALVAACALAMILGGAWIESAVGAGTALIIVFNRRLPASLGGIAPPLAGLGAISYSLYLLHVPIGGKLVNLGRRVVEGDIAEFGLSTAALGLSIAAATLFWRLIERPSINAARRLRAPLRQGKRAMAAGDA